MLYFEVKHLNKVTTTNALFPYSFISTIIDHIYIMIYFVYRFYKFTDSIKKTKIINYLSMV